MSRTRASTRPGVAKYAMLRPAADLEDLEQVFVITDYVSE